jgi:uncharacterized protein YhfF
MQQATASVTAFWQKFLATQADGAALSFTEAQQFGSGTAMGDELAALILAGTKTATCSCLWEWQAEGNPIPVAGSLSILLDGRGAPCAVLEITEVAVRQFDEVGAEFAAAEGEGDRSLETWRHIHWQWFSKVLPPIGRAPSRDMPLVCERFHVRYAEPPVNKDPR